MTTRGPYLSIILPKKSKATPETTRPIEAIKDAPALVAPNCSCTGLMKTEKLVQTPDTNNNVIKDESTTTHPNHDLFIHIGPEANKQKMKLK
jgi:hypothetical protein